MKLASIEHTFVESIPEALDEGVLYISVRYRTSSHMCACGCGSRVVTPIRPAKWQLIYDGDTISLWPSIGNWQKPCRSHYVIRRDQIIWAKPWSDEKIAAGREHDQLELRRYYEGRAEQLGSRNDD
jgi:hypothetical protein